MTEYDFYIPLFDNNGRRMDGSRLQRLKRELTDVFGGLTYFPQRNEGRWKVGKATFRDKIVILRVLSDNSRRTKRILKRLKTAIKRDWNQTDVLIIARAVRTV
jgi:hypothetical protein